MKENNIVLDIKDLAISFKQYDKGFSQTQLQVINHLDVTVPAGKMVAVVGSSGSGKSLLAHAVMGISGPLTRFRENFTVLMMLMTRIWILS